MDGFDPYLAWLDIGADQRPVSPQRLLGLRPEESDAGAIANAAARVIAHLTQFATGEQADACRRLIAEVGAAREQLLQPGRSATQGSRTAEVPLAGPAASHAASAAGALWSERQIKAPPAVPMAGAKAPSAPSIQAEPASQPLVPPGGAPAPLVRQAPPPPATASVASIVAAPAPALPIVGAPFDGSAAGATLPAAGSPGPQAVTPVGVPLGQPFMIAAAPVVEAPAIVSPAPIEERSWIPEQRTGHVSKSIVATAEEGQGESLPTAGTRRFVRRTPRRQQNYVAAMLTIGGVCLALLVGLLVLVALNR